MSQELLPGIEFHWKTEDAYREDIEELEECPMKQYLLDLEPIPARDFHDYFPNADEEAIKLLKGMLEFSILFPWRVMIP